MSNKNPVLGLSLYFIGVLLVAFGIFRVRFYASTTIDIITSIIVIILGAGIIIYINNKKQKQNTKK